MGPPCNLYHPPQKSHYSVGKSPFLGLVMLLRIQREETIRSLLARNFLFNSDSPSFKEFKRLANRPIGTKELRAIAEDLGWPGCHGFNRLLHNHTSYPDASIFRFREDISYSNSVYLYDDRAIDFGLEEPAFCPECIREDIARLGYPVWRREICSINTVCGKHELKLLRGCPYCPKDNLRNEHSILAMWNGCNGRHYVDAPAIAVNDVSSNLRAKFRWQAFNSGYVISIEAALLAMHERCSLSDFSKLQNDCNDREIIEMTNRSIREIESGAFVFRGMRIDRCSHLIWYYAPVIYGDFNNFLDDVRSFEPEPIRATSLFSTYISWGRDVPNFIVEDCVGADSSS